MLEFWNIGHEVKLLRYHGFWPPARRAYPLSELYALRALYEQEAGLEAYGLEAGSERIMEWWV